MDILIKILFILSLIVANVSVLKSLVDHTTNDTAEIGFVLLCAFDCFVVMLMFIIMHGEYMKGIALLAASVFAGAVVLAVSTMLYVEIFDRPRKV